MVTVYAILGDSNTRKSSTVRALTGVAQRKEVRVATVAGDIDVFVNIKSLQEANISPQQFIREVAAGEYTNVLVPLLVSEMNIHPQEADYIQAFLNAGWTIQQLVVLGALSLATPLPAGIPRPNFVSDSTSIPVNRIASRVRSWWGWL